eukprot:3520168-Alexandrium_andersonii.AAC.1
MAAAAAPWLSRLPPGRHATPPSSRRGWRRSLGLRIALAAASSLSAGWVETSAPGGCPPCSGWPSSPSLIGGGFCFLDV